jgi:hypothetical protein
LPRILAEELRREGHYALHTRDLPGENIHLTQKSVKLQILKI